MSDDRLLIEQEEAELIAHLQDISQASFADMESLARIRERLIHAQAPDDSLSIQASVPVEDGIILPFPIQPQANKRAGWARRLNALAAVLVIVVLVGALTGTFVYLRGLHTNASSNASAATQSSPAKHAPMPSHTGIFLVDAQTAWAQTVTPLPGEGDVAGPLLRTIDGGKTWQDVTPPQSGFDVTSDFYPIDGTTAWLVSELMPAATVLRTVDGGVSWQTFSLPTFSLGGHTGSVDIRFISRDLGWISETLQDKNGQVTITNYLTTDGARTWRKLAALSNVSSADNQLPDSSLQFINAQTGWFLVRASQRYSLYATTDGGQSWQKESLPVALQALTSSSGGTNNSASLHFFDAQNGYIVVTHSRMGKVSYTLYPTHDGGRSWQSGADMNGEDGFAISPLNFLNAQHIIMVWSKGFALYTLTQGHWLVTSSYTLAHGFLLNASFASSSDGLMIVDEAKPEGDLNGDDIRLLKTSDGGVTWSELKVLPAVSKLTPATMGYLTSTGWTYFTAHEGFGPENFTTRIQTGSGNAAPATLPHLVARKWLVRFMCVQDHRVTMELNGQSFTVANCAQQPTSTVVTLSSAQAFASLKVHAAVGSRWLVTLLACSDEKAC